MNPSRFTILLLIIGAVGFYAMYRDGMRQRDEMKWFRNHCTVTEYSAETGAKFKCK